MAPVGTNPASLYESQFSPPEPAQELSIGAPHTGIWVGTVQEGGRTVIPSSDTQADGRHASKHGIPGVAEWK
jgi:hypothetical protein